MAEINLAEEVENDIINMWKDSLSSDMDGREALYRELHGLKALMTRLKAKVQAGIFKQKEK
jgi:hypothetical protein